jgi:Lantibiotic dehydratase, N terminus
MRCQAPDANDDVTASADHLIELPGTDWKAWRQAVLRTTGFPADGLDRFRVAEIARIADLHLAGQVGRETFETAFADAEERSSCQARAIAADSLFREAVTWQNPSALSALDGVLKERPAGTPKSRVRLKQRMRERMISRYWQRYCAKTETIGFFGPVCWVDLDTAGPAVRASPGQDLLRERRVYLEYWAVAEYADRVASHPDARRWLSPVLQPHLAIFENQLLHPLDPPRDLTRAEAAVLGRVDGCRTAEQIASEAAADRLSGLRRPDDVYLLLERLVARGVIRWDFDIPVARDCAELLGARIARIGDVEVRSRAAAGLDRLLAARDKVAAAAGKPAALHHAITMLESEFAAITDRSADRLPGEMYAGRKTYWEETTRDLTITFGSAILEAIAQPLAVLLQVARWLSDAMAAAYSAALREIYCDLSAEIRSREVPLGQIWFLAQSLFYGSSKRPADQVAADLAHRWSSLFQMDNKRLNRQELQVSSVDLLPAARRIFPAECPAWPEARIHSPDLQICAESTEALNRGDFTVVLGELHAAWPSNSTAVFVAGHPDPAALTAALTADLGQGRIYPLLPVDWPRYTPRLAFALEDAHDVRLGVMPAPGADPEKLLPVSTLSVAEVGEFLIAMSRDGRSWPLPAIFARLLSEVTVETFKLVGTAPHTPRIMIDRMVVSRETWRTTVSESGLTRVANSADGFLAARRWRLALGLPERVFIKVKTEVKPTYVDFSGPLYVASFLHMLRAAMAKGGEDVEVCATEMIPTPDQAWLPDAAGRRYLSELRLQVRDPHRPQTHTGVVSA